MLESIRLPFCDVLSMEAWNAPPGRYFAAFRARHGFRWLLGHAVLEEFGTLSSPVFFAPRALLGKVYDAGITLAHRRDPEMTLDLGWPPLCVGLDLAVPSLAADWQGQLLAAIVAGRANGDPLPAQARTVAGHALAVIGLGGPEPAARARVIATSAPLLPAQLGRLCDLDDGAFTLALASGNRVTRQAQAAPQALSVASEAVLRRLLAALGDLLGTP